MNTDDPDHVLRQAEIRVLEIQTKLHRWASDDPHRELNHAPNGACGEPGAL